MKKLLLIAALMACSLTSLVAQPCLPEGITFSTQEEIDNFQTNYPNCTEIEGDVTIDGGEIANLEGLSVLTSIGGNLQVGNLEYGGNTTLINLVGLDSLTSIGGDLNIWNNYALTSLTGLEKLIFVGGSIQIGYEYMFSGMWGNPSLTSLYGLENIEAASIENLTIIGNSSLSFCNIQNICNYLTAPNGTVRVYDNGSGCYSPSEIATSCGFQITCLPFGDYYFFTQSDIENFQSVYPGCTELEGNVIIHGFDITDLEGLNSLTSISGSLNLINISLYSLSGLENLTTIGGDLWLKSTGLNTLAGLENLTSVGGSLILETNFDIISLSGLEGLTSIGGDLRIIEHWELASLWGLENLNSIGGEIYIFSNDELTNMSALEGLNSIGGDILILGNPVLTTLSGLSNIEVTSIGNLFIANNASLHTCNIESICEYLAAPNGTINIYNNAPGCSSFIDVAMACGGSLPCLPYGNYYFTSQADVDNFPLVFPDCNEIEGSLILGGNNISNLEGLSTLTSISESFIGGTWQSGTMLTSFTSLENLTLIGGDIRVTLNPLLTSLTGLEGINSIAGEVYIRGNPSLTSLTGLDSLSTIGQNLRVCGNVALTSMTGLGNLTAIGGYLNIGPPYSGNLSLSSLTGLENLTSIGEYIDISDNDALISLSGLENLTSLGGDLLIKQNDALTSLMGLESIEQGSIENLKIHENYALSSCQAQSICDYLSNPNGTVEIFDNATGCNSIDEVWDACFSFAAETGDDFKNNFAITPNPLASNTLIEYTLKNNSPVTLIILDFNGREIVLLVNEVQQQGEQGVIFNSAILKPGVYFCVLKTNSEVKTTKLIKL